MSEYLYLLETYKEKKKKEKRLTLAFFVAVILVIILPYVNARTDFIYMNTQTVFTVLLFIYLALALVYIFVPRFYFLSHKAHFQQIAHVLNKLEIKNDHQEFFTFFTEYHLEHYYKGTFENLYERVCLQNFQESEQKSELVRIINEIDRRFDLGEDDKLLDDAFTKTAVYSQQNEHMNKGNYEVPVLPEQTDSAFLTRELEDLVSVNKEAEKVSVEVGEES